MVDMLGHASSADDELRLSAISAFESFLAFGDRVNRLSALRPEATPGAPWPSEDWIEMVKPGCREALTHLRGAIEQLTRIAPRTRNEEPLPDLADLKVTGFRLQKPA
jgi:hypothetical protein